MDLVHKNLAHALGMLGVRTLTWREIVAQQMISRHSLAATKMSMNFRLSIQATAKKHQISHVSDMADRNAAINPPKFVPRRNPHAKLAFQLLARSPTALMLPGMAVTRTDIPSAAILNLHNAPMRIDRTANLKNYSRMIRIATMMPISGATKGVFQHAV